MWIVDFIKIYLWILFRFILVINDIIYFFIVYMYELKGVFFFGKLAVHPLKNFIEYKKLINVDNRNINVTIFIFNIKIHRIKKLLIEWIKS